MHERGTGKSIHVSRHREHWHAGRLRHPERRVFDSRSTSRAQFRETHQDELRRPHPSGGGGGGHRLATFHACTEEGGESHGLVNLPPNAGVSNL